jgi:hypothetical protein
MNDWAMATLTWKAEGFQVGAGHRPVMPSVNSYWIAMKINGERTRRAGWGCAPDLMLARLASTGPAIQGEDAQMAGHRAVTPWSARSVKVRILPSPPLPYQTNGRG